MRTPRVGCWWNRVNWGGVLPRCGYWLHWCIRGVGLGVSCIPGTGQDVLSGGWEGKT